MVLVLGEALESDWVRIVTITSSAESTREYVDYLPIFPTRKNQHTRLNQLNLCHDSESWTLLNKRSYVKINSVGEVPLDLLQPAYAEESGLQFQLQMKSATKVINRVARWERNAAAAAEREAAEEATLDQIAQVEQDFANISIAVKPAQGRFPRENIWAACTPGEEHVQYSSRGNVGDHEENEEETQWSFEAVEAMTLRRNRHNTVFK